MPVPDANKKTLHAFFGGSFDPPHLGHDDILRALLKDPLVDKVHLVPTGQNPLKHSSVGAERDEWIQVWIRSLSKDLPTELTNKLQLEKIEMEEALKGKNNFTVETLAFLQERQEGRWILALGSDLIPQLSQWKDIKNLLSRLHSLWIFPRQGLSFLAKDFDPELRAYCPLRWMLTEPRRAFSSEIREVLKSKMNPASLPILPELALSLRRPQRGE